MTTPTETQQQSIIDFVDANSETDVDDLLDSLIAEFSPDVVAWWSAQWLNLLDGAAIAPEQV